MGQVVADRVGFDQAQRADAAAWKADLALLEKTQERLLQAIRDATPEQLARVPAAGDQSIARQLLGMSLHDTYHAGQIRMLALILGQTS